MDIAGPNAECKPRKIKVTELLLRDAHQSLLATRMRLEDMLPICEQIDKVGYWSAEVWGGATYDSCLRFLGEDPWVRLRELKKALPNTPLQMLLRGQNILGYRHYADDVVRRFVDKSIKYGMDVFRIFDALNDVRNLETAVKSVIDGGAHAQGAICYTLSPVHTLDKFVQMGRDLESMGCHSIVIKDMAALMCPVPAYKLVKALKEAVKVPVHVHTHATTGVAWMVLLRAVDAGADGVDTAISALSGGPGHVPTEAFVESVAGTPFDTGLKQEDMIPIAEYTRSIRGKYKEFESSFTGADPRIFISQIPGGMLSNMESQLKQQGCMERIDEVLEEVPRVRAEMGYIPLVTPTSQIVGTQAVLNVMMGERYKTVSRESKDVFAGRYGRTPVPVDEAIQKKVLGDDKPITCRPADLIPNEFDKLTAEIADRTTDEDQVLSYALFPKVWEKFWENRNKPKEAAAPAAAPAPAAPAPAPAAPAAPAAAPARAIGPATRLNAGGRVVLGLTIEGRTYEAAVEVVEP
ncbi:MAG: oxaloacetate decarboxylase (Na+ extruding) subunit alpha [Candidatus Sumerlaeota bacterium]|nr:oxaloacetate decarboxylase (Na+ extruding) subunit alpha [Candidatus Sumerlaeota bacterium]